MSTGKTQLYAGKSDESGATPSQSRGENVSSAAAVAKNYGEPTDNQQGSQQLRLFQITYSSLFGSVFLIDTFDKINQINQRLRTMGYNGQFVEVLMSLVGGKFAYYTPFPIRLSLSKQTEIEEIIRKCIEENYIC